MRRVILLCAALLCLWLPAGMAEEEAERIAGGLDVSEWQAYADAAGLEIDVRETLLSLVSAQDGWDVQGRVTDTFVDGRHVYQNGAIVKE